MFRSASDRNVCTNASISISTCNSNSNNATATATASAATSCAAARPQRQPFNPGSARVRADEPDSAHHFRLGAALAQSSLMPRSTATLIHTGTSRAQSVRVSARFLGLLGMAKVSRT